MNARSTRLRPGRDFVSAFGAFGAIGVVLSIRSEIDRIFTNGDRVVACRRSIVTSCGGLLLDLPDVEFTGSIDVVSILTIENGKGLHHLDFADDDGIQARIPEIRRRLGSNPPAAPRCPRAAAKVPEKP